MGRLDDRWMTREAEVVDRREIDAGIDPAVVRRDFRAPTGQLDLTVLGKDDGMVTTARTSIRHAGGKFHAPPGALYRLQGDDLHFYAEGLARIELPAGRYQLKAAKGPEYRVARAEFEVKAGETTPDVGAVAARVLAQCRPPKAPAPPEVKLFAPLLKDARWQQS